MMTRDAHLRQARDNEFLAERLLQWGDSIAVTWAATVVFYAAVHYGRAHLVTKTSATIRTHNGFEAVFRSTWPKPRELIAHHRWLKDRSEKARYDCVVYTEAEVVDLRDDHLRPLRDAILAALGVP